jgi:hypothetical protein
MSDSSEKNPAQVAYERDLPANLANPVVHPDLIAARLDPAPRPTKEPPRSQVEMPPAIQRGRGMRR